MVPENEVVTVDHNLPDYIASDKGQRMGFEDKFDREDRQIPRIKVDQDSGDLINSLTGEAYPTPFQFIPILKWKEWIKWKPLDEGGGIEYRTTDREDERLRGDGKWGENGEKPTATPYLHFLVMPLHNGKVPVVLSFSRSGYAAGKKLLNMSALMGGNMFSRRYEAIVELGEYKAAKKEYYFQIG